MTDLSKAAENERPTELGPVISFKLHTVEGEEVAFDIQRFDETEGTIALSLDGKVFVTPPEQADDIRQALALCLGPAEE